MKAYILWNEDSHVVALHQSETGALAAIQEKHEGAPMNVKRDHGELFVDVENYFYRIEGRELKG